MKPDEVLLIGVDGGATEAKAHAAACDDLRSPTSFELRQETSVLSCSSVDVILGRW